jgi:hypothetical protein
MAQEYRTKIDQKINVRATKKIEKRNRTRYCIIPRTSS